MQTINSSLTKLGDKSSSFLSRSKEATSYTDKERNSEGAVALKRERIWNNSRDNPDRQFFRQITEECIQQEDEFILEGVEADVYIHGRERSNFIKADDLSDFNDRIDDGDIKKEVD